MIQIECPLCGEPCRMEMAAIAAEEWVLYCQACSIAVEVGEPVRGPSSAMALAA